MNNSCIVKKEMKYYVYNGNMEDTFLGFNACGNFRRCLRDNSRHFSSGSILMTKQWESVPSWYFFRKKTHSDWPTLYKPLIYFIFSWFLDYFRDEYVGKWWWLIDRQFVKMWLKLKRKQTANLKIVHRARISRCLEWISLRSD